MVWSGPVAHLPAGVLLGKSSQTSGQAFSWLYHSSVLHSSLLPWATWHLQSVFFLFFFFLAFWRRTQDKRTKKNKGKRFHGIQNLWLNHVSPFSNLAYLIFAEGCPSEEPAAFLIDEESSLFCSKCLSFPFLKSTRLNKVLANACFWVLDLGLEGRMLVEQ